VHAAIVDHRPDEVDDLRKDEANVDRLQREVDRARLDPRDVKHLVDELEEVPSPFDDLACVALLLRRGGVHLEKLAEADHRVQRRA
jgi:hypothetical protein